MAESLSRARWIDVTRGFAILFVVMHHAGTYERALFSVPTDGVNDIWLGIELLLYHLRLPLFFFISGALGSGYFSRSGTPKAGSILKLARAYWLWAIILSMIAPNWPTDGVSFSLSLWQILGLAWGMSVAWYLWAIVLCFAFAWATRRLPAPLAVIAAIAYGALLQWDFERFGGSIHSLGRCLPLYILGFRYPALGSRIVDRWGFRYVSFPLVIYLSALGASARFPIPELILDLGGVIVGLLLVGLFLRRMPRQSVWIEWIGLRTLPIYLLHFPIIALLGCEAIRRAAPLTPGNPLILFYVPLLTALTVSLSLLLHALIVRAGGARFFAPPPLMSLFQRKGSERSDKITLSNTITMDGKPG